VLRTLNGSLPTNCSTFPTTRHPRALVGAKTGLKPLCSPYAGRQHPPLPPQITSGKLGVMKVDLRHTKLLEWWARSPIARLVERGARSPEIRRGCEWTRLHAKK
jgi:hypothetical protein